MQPRAGLHFGHRLEERRGPELDAKAPFQLKGGEIAVFHALSYGKVGQGASSIERLGVALKQYVLWHYLRTMLDELKQKAARGELEVSEHAVKQMIRRNIDTTELLEAIAAAELVEDYPEAEYGPCCLLFGRTATKRPLHLVVTHPVRPRLRVITAYEPDPALWLNFTIRRPKP